MEQNQQKRKRNFALDLLRVLACLLVIWQHASEYYYIGENVTIVHADSTYTIGFLTSFDRICVPLFVMISGYFLLPMKVPTGTFFKKRFTRILYPFLFWCVAFAVYYVFYRGDSLAACLTNIAHIPLNFGTEVGHLWYIYMLIGMYLLVPVLSPWLERCTKRELQFYLGIWFITTFLPYIHLVFPAGWGECTWNVSPSLYYFTGFWGYLVLGFYAKKYGVPSVISSVLMIIVGYAVSVYAFNTMVPLTDSAAEAELGWDFCCANVALMTWGFFSLISRVKVKKDTKITAIITDISLCSYGMYLAHIMLLNAWHDLLADRLPNVLAAVPAIALCTFITTYLVVKGLSYLPKSKYWLGTD